MDFKQQVFSIIAQMTGQNNIITVNVALVDFVGDLETGLFLSQVIYWADKTKRTDGYFYKTDEEWNQELKLSKYSIRKARKKLENMGILETKVKKANGNPTVHYKLNEKRFSEMFISFLRNQKNEIANTKNQNFENEKSLTEITTEITTSKYVGMDATDFYQQNFGMLNPFITTQIIEWSNDLSEEMVIEAMKIALSRNKHTWSYVNGILREWAKRNVKTLQDVQALQKGGTKNENPKPDDYLNHLF